MLKGLLFSSDLLVKLHKAKSEGGGDVYPCCKLNPLFPIVEQLEVINEDFPISVCTDRSGALKEKCSMSTSAVRVKEDGQSVERVLDLRQASEFSYLNVLESRILLSPAYRLFVMLPPPRQTQCRGLRRGGFLVLRTEENKTCRKHAARKTR